MRLYGKIVFFALTLLVGLAAVVYAQGLSIGGNGATIGGNNGGASIGGNGATAGGASIGGNGATVGANGNNKGPTTTLGVTTVASTTSSPTVTKVTTIISTGSPTTTGTPVVLPHTNSADLMTDGGSLWACAAALFVFVSSIVLMG